MCHVIFKIQLVQLGNILHLFNIQITAHLFHGRLHLNIRICCNYPEISSGRLLLNNCGNSWSFTTRYSVRVVFGPSRVRVGQKISSTSRVSSTRRALIQIHLQYFCIRLAAFSCSATVWKGVNLNLF